MWRWLEKLYSELCTKVGCYDSTASLILDVHDVQFAVTHQIICSCFIPVVKIDVRMKFMSDVCRLQWLLNNAAGKSLFCPLGFLPSVRGSCTSCGVT